MHVGDWFGSDECKGLKTCLDFVTNDRYATANVLIDVDFATYITYEVANEKTHPRNLASCIFLSLLALPTACACFAT